MGREQFAQMKPSACLINVSRGGIVDDDALCDALAADRLAAAYIDVPRRIPPGRHSRLYRTRGIVLTHYSAANVRSATGEAFQRFTEALKALLADEQPPDLVA
jgi:D-3-phosphoglycerate dehydrogenase